MSDDTELCPVCGSQYVHKRIMKPRKARGTKTGVESIDIRDDYTACRETRTEIQGDHGNWKDVQITDVYVHNPNTDQ